MVNRPGRPLEKVQDADLDKPKFLKFRITGRCNNEFVDHCKTNGIDGQQWFMQKLHSDGICLEGGEGTAA
jgi:hypothetical protein